MDVQTRKGRSAWSLAAAPSEFSEGCPRPGAVHTVKVLLKYGADIAARDADGNIAEVWARWELRQGKPRENGMAFFEAFHMGREYQALLSR